MADPLLRTKLFIPAPRPSLVPRPRLIQQLQTGIQLNRRLSLISAPAGFGKTTLVSDWLSAEAQPVAWLSLDEADGDLGRFLTYFVAAIQTVAADVGTMVESMLQAQPLPPVEALMTALVNDLAGLRQPMMLVLDDYHVLDSAEIDQAIAFLLDHQPPQLHLVVLTREDPNLPLHRLRARGQLTELRVADLRFGADEAAAFLNQVMGLTLTSAEVDALSSRTEGWVAGLQMAALSMQGQANPADFIDSFTGSHQFVLDYLMAEVLAQQSPEVAAFLVNTAVVDRLSGPLCDAMLQAPAGTGQSTLTYLAQANLFTIPLDNDRRWFRYHHLFADLLRQRLVASPDGAARSAELHQRASDWFAANGLPFDAFRHATAVDDIDRATQILTGGEIPLQYESAGATSAILTWLTALPTAELDAHPALWVTYASTLMLSGEVESRVEQAMQAAETHLTSAESNDATTRDLLGQIAAIRAMLAIPHNNLDTILDYSQQALAQLHPENVVVRTNLAWAQGYAFQVQGQRAAARHAYTEALAASEAAGNRMMQIATQISMGQVLESQLALTDAAERYQQTLALMGEPPWATACEAFLGLARIAYEQNELDSAEAHSQESLKRTVELPNVDTAVPAHVLLARIRLAQGDGAAAAGELAQAEHIVGQKGFVHWRPTITLTRVDLLLQTGNVAGAAALVADEDAVLDLGRVRVWLAQGNAAEALALAERIHADAVDRDWQDVAFRSELLAALAAHTLGQRTQALQRLAGMLPLAEANLLRRPFLDEGERMGQWLISAEGPAFLSPFVVELKAAFGAVVSASSADALVDPLTERELDVLRLLGTELTGPEIANHLSVSLNTLRSHTKNIYTKLGVGSRRAAVNRAMELKLM